MTGIDDSLQLYNCTISNSHITAESQTHSEECLKHNPGAEVDNQSDAFAHCANRETWWSLTMESFPIVVENGLFFL